MLHRLAARVPTRWSIVVALAALAAATIATLSARSPASDPTSPTPTIERIDGRCAAVATDPHDVHAGEIHALLQPGAAIAGAHHLFTRLPAIAAAGDERPRWFVIAPGTISLDTLEHDPRVVEAFVEPDTQIIDESLTRDSADGDSCPITTPSYDAKQGYVGPAPAGIDAPAAWSLGVRGQGVQFADIEGGWNSDHEDLPGDRIEHVAGRRMTDIGWRAHGTAVLGEVVGRANGKGVTGLAPDVDRVYTASIQGVAVADAISAAADRLHAGDVLLIELQRTGPRGRFLPMEYWDDEFAAIRAATDRGVVVIEAAGNGGEDLDHSAYKGKLSRGVRDSGAIMVGAGAPARSGWRDRERLDFSNYGSRVDVQGWGRKVATLDYGDLQACDDRSRDRHYTDNFSGTSSASPIVAGAAILVESHAQLGGGAPLPPREVRRLLTETGTPQVGDTKRHIGPRPDLSRALK